MKKATLVASLVLASGCLKSGSGPAIPSTVMPGLSLVTTPVSFKPMGLGFDSVGDLVSAQPDVPQVNVLDSQTFGVLENDAIPADSSSWAPPLSSTGYMGGLYYRAGNGSVYTFDIVQHTTALFVSTQYMHVFQARADSPGIIWSDVQGTLHFDNPSGAETLTASVGPKLQVDSIASTASGMTYAFASSGGLCNSIVTFDASGKHLASIPAQLGASPCLVSVTLDGTVVVGSGTTAQGTQVQAFQGGSMTPVSQALTITGMAAQKLVLSADGSHLAVLAGPEPMGTSVALALLPDLFTDTQRGNQGPFRTIQTTSIPSAVDGVFDDGNILYIADSQSQAIDMLE